MSQQTTIRKLAELVNTPVEKLLEQLAEAGMSFSGPDQVVTSMEKVKLLGFLKRSHGKAADSADDIVAPTKITLSRSRKQEITVGGGGKTGGFHALGEWIDVTDAWKGAQNSLLTVLGLVGVQGVSDALLPKRPPRPAATK